jgi:hypothetical protein
MDQVEASLNAIESSSMNALEIVESTPKDLSVVCPLIDESYLKDQIGIDLNNVIDAIAVEYNNLKGEVTAQLAFGNNIVDRMESGISGFEATVTTTEDYLWVVPALLFIISILAAISIAGVVLAWKDKSDIRLQRAMSYIVLPLLILTSIGCWMVVVVTSFSSMVGTGKWSEFFVLLPVQIFSKHSANNCCCCFIRPPF